MRTKRRGCVLMGVAAAALVLSGCAFLDTEESPSTSAPADAPTDPPVAGEPATLASVTDGDTVRVLLADGENVPVRLIGVDTPEVYSGVECGGREASAHVAALVSPGDPVVLVTDPTQDESDRYDRLLRYVDLPDGTDLGESVIAAGWGEPYVYEVEFTRLARYTSAEKQARSADPEPLGLWSQC